MTRRLIWEPVDARPTRQPACHPFPCPVAANSVSCTYSTMAAHNSVVAYIYKQYMYWCILFLIEWEAQLRSNAAQFLSLYACMRMPAKDDSNTGREEIHSSTISCCCSAGGLITLIYIYPCFVPVALLVALAEICWACVTTVGMSRDRTCHGLVAFNMPPVCLC